MTTGKYLKLVQPPHSIMDRARLHDRLGKSSLMYYINPFTAEVVCMDMYSLQQDRHLEALKGQGVTDIFFWQGDQYRWSQNQLADMKGRAERLKIVLDKQSELV